LARKATSERNYVHGGAGTRLYRIWLGMKRRTADPRRNNYHRYGGRGITVCEEWKDSFAVFRDWALANGYRDDLSIDRIDNDGNYEPGNCRWNSAKAQSNNTRRNVFLTVGGETHTVAEWTRKLGLQVNIITKRLGLGWSVERALGLEAVA